MFQCRNHRNQFNYCISANSLGICPYRWVSKDKGSQVVYVWQSENFCLEKTR